MGTTTSYFLTCSLAELTGDDPSVKPLAIEAMERELYERTERAHFGQWLERQPCQLGGDDGFAALLYAGAARDLHPRILVDAFDRSRWEQPLRAMIFARVGSAERWELYGASTMRIDHSRMKCQACEEAVARGSIVHPSPVVAVCSSPLLPVSHATCRWCLRDNVVPLSEVLYVASDAGGLDDLTDQAHEIALASARHSGLTEDELQAMIVEAARAECE